MRLLIIILLSSLGLFAQAQQTLSVRVTGKDNLPVVASIIIKGTTTGFSTDSSGMTSISFPSNGSFMLVVTAVGYEEKEVRITIPNSKTTIEIELEAADHEMEEVIVQSTRTSRTIANVPTRIETIELEEIDEKSNMRPGNVAMLLNESTGIRVQQTSATSANAGIRIQGLDGRYTQLLKDGFPNYGNFASGLSVLEIPPLDLKQVEIIKGPASPLFGGGAIAGVVNFISKSPKEKPEYNFILNQSNIGQSNAGFFAAQRGKKLGYTLLALYNRASAYDADKDDFTEVPQSNEFTFHPKLFLYPNPSLTIIFGNSFTAGKRTGGDMQVIKGNADASHQYFEKNKTIRNTSSIEVDKKLSEKKSLVVKQSVNVFDRVISIPSYTFDGFELNSFTDLSYISNGEKHAFVAGGNFIYNRFDEKNNPGEERDNTVRTAGLYAQHTWDATEKMKLETGLRMDRADYRNAIYSHAEVFLLPRISLLVKYNSRWSSRFGGGMGYKTPTVFTEETESIQYRNVEQLSNLRSEKSYGGTADINFRTLLGEEFSFSLNHMFFYTRITKPLVLEKDAVNHYRFVNANQPVESLGFETNAKFIFREHLKLFLGYTYTNAKAQYLSGKQYLPLVPKNKLNTALIYEKEEVVKLGLEGYFTGPQYLMDGSRTPSYSVFGFMAEKLFNHFSLFINFENFTDTRQGKYKNVVNGSHLDPYFDEIWTHTEGFVVNGGVKLKF